jgi:hypothetical protein
MFTRRRGDTLVETVERQYGVNLHCRRDTLLRNLLSERGFVSQSELLNAYFGRLTYHARKRRVFLTFHYEDRDQIAGFRLMIHNPNVALDLHDFGLTEEIRSDRKPYIRQAIKQKIARAEVVVCLIGNGTAWREWVDWELETGLELRKGLCGVRLKDSHGRTPPLLREVGAPVAAWDVQEIVSVIEKAAARRT